MKPKEQVRKHIRFNNRKAENPVVKDSREVDESRLILRYAVLPFKQRFIADTDMDETWKIDALVTLKDPYIDLQLAANPITSDETLSVFATHDSIRIRMTVAKNPSTSKTLLKLMTLDDSPTVAKEAADRLAEQTYMRRVKLKT